MARKKKSGIEAELISGIGVLLFLWLYFAHPTDLLPKLWAIAEIGIAIAVVVFVIFYFYRKKSRFSSPSRTEPDLGSDPWRNEPDQDLYPIWRDCGAATTEARSVDTTRWSLELLNALEWKRFEELAAGFFQCVGFKSKTQRCGADGGVDIHLYHVESEKPAVIVQCKAWKSYKVGVKPIRELLGVMAQLGVKEGVFLTTGTYTNEARGFKAPEGMAMDLIDGHGFLDKIASLSPQQRSWLLEVATAGDFTTPTCARCGVKMVLRESKKNGSKFWGCRNYPGCRMTLKYAG